MTLIHLKSNSNLGDDSLLRFTANSHPTQKYLFNSKVCADDERVIQRIYYDFGLNLDLLDSGCSHRYLVVGDTHHLPCLLLSLDFLQKTSGFLQIYFYGKPTHYRFFELVGFENVKPAPLDWYLLEAISQTKN